MNKEFKVYKADRFGKYIESDLIGMGTKWTQKDYEYYRKLSLIHNDHILMVITGIKNSIVEYIFKAGKEQ